MPESLLIQTKAILFLSGITPTQKWHGKGLLYLSFLPYDSII